MSSLKMLALDLGASSGRGIVGCFDGKRITLEEVHRFNNDPVTLSGGLYWDILRLYQDIKAAIQNCSLSGHKDIQSISIDTWGVDFGLIAADGSLLSNPYCYRDTRTTQAIMQEVFDRVGRQRLYEITGTQFLNFNTIYQLYAIAKQQPYLLEHAESLLFVPDLLKYFLTGVKETEYTIASTSQLLDAGRRDWSFDLIETLGLQGRIFGPLVQPGHVTGALLPQIAEETGITGAKVVACASHDTASAVVSVPAKQEDFVYISSGTWSLMGKELKEPLTGETAYQFDLTNEGGAERKIRFLKNIMGLWIEQESRRQWAREGEKLSFDALSDMAMASEPLKCLIDPDDLRFQPPGNMPKRIAQYCKETGQYVPQTKGEIVRCIFDSLALCYRNTLEKIDQITGKRAPFLHIVGGGTKEAPLCQLAASACGRPVYAGPVEATSLGNLAVQAIAAGEIRDIAQAREVIANSFEMDVYEPSADDVGLWDEGMLRFRKLVDHQQK